MGRTAGPGGSAVPLRRPAAAVSGAAGAAGLRRLEQRRPGVVRRRAAPVRPVRPPAPRTAVRPVRSAAVRPAPVRSAAVRPAVRTPGPAAAGLRQRRLGRRRTPPGAVPGRPVRPLRTAGRRLRRRAARLLRHPRGVPAAGAAHPQARRARAAAHRLGPRTGRGGARLLRRRGRGRGRRRAGRRPRKPGGAQNQGAASPRSAAADAPVWWSAWYSAAAWQASGISATSFTRIVSARPRTSRAAATASR